MSARKKILTYTYIYASAILVLAVWLLSFLKNNGKMHFNFDVESLGLSVIGLIAFLVSVFVEDSFYLASLVSMLPFAFAKSFYMNSLPAGIFLLVGFAVLGMALHLIIYPPSIKKGTYFYSLLVFCVGMCLGGLIKSESFWTSFVASFSLSLFIVLVYMYIVTYLDRHQFVEICHIMLGVSFVLTSQTVLFQYIINRYSMFLFKNADYGWGCTNNLALMCLLAIPFLVYLTINSKTFIASIASCFTALDCLAIMLNFSRGATFVMFLIVPVCIVYAFIKSKTKLIFVLYHVIMCFGVFIIFVSIHEGNDEVFKKIFENILNFNVDTLNGRREVYRVILKYSKDYPIFGRGLLAPMDSTAIIESGYTDTYFWGHNSFIHALYISGFVGVGCLCYHLYTKYLALLKNPNVKKILACLALVGSGLYGLMDISYYYIIYMVVMIMLLALLENEILDTFEGEEDEA